MFGIRTTCISLLIVVGKYSCQQFSIPDVILEAYTPKGFRASIHDVIGLSKFTFHANLNKDISRNEPGEYTGGVTNINLTWTYFNPDLQLKIGDTISYWCFVNYRGLGYRKSNKWTVKELLPLTRESCNATHTRRFDKTGVCAKDVILEDYFDGDEIDKSKWTVEHYIPTKSPDFEFVSYQNRKDVCFVQDGKLFLKPKAAETEQKLRGTLDLSNGCTRSSAEECVYTQYGAYLIPPVTSARLVSRLKFVYGTVEIKAKLPEGDWVYPQIYLEQVAQPNRKLWIAYARGNDVLSKNEADDIGSRLLLGGAVLDPTEPGRNTRLKSTRQSTPFSNDFHTYKIIWGRKAISFWVDDVQYGNYSYEDILHIQFSRFDAVRLVLGVGVGGINDFPNGYRSNGQDKPWMNKDRYQVKNFYAAASSWIQTWKGDSVALQVDSVKITAVDDD